MTISKKLFTEIYRNIIMTLDMEGLFNYVIVYVENTVHIVYVRKYLNK